MTDIIILLLCISTGVSCYVISVLVPFCKWMINNIPFSLVLLTFCQFTKTKQTKKTNINPFGKIEKAIILILLLAAFSRGSRHVFLKSACVRRTWFSPQLLVVLQEQSFSEETNGCCLFRQLFGHPIWDNKVWLRCNKKKAWTCLSASLSGETGNGGSRGGRVVDFLLAWQGWIGIRTSTSEDSQGWMSWR